MVQGLSGSLFAIRPGIKLPFRAIARKLQISEGTVRNRVEEMRSSGVLVGTSLQVNPPLLGLELGAYCVDVSPEIPKRDAIEKFKLVEGMTIVQNHHGSLVGLVFLYEGESRLKRKLELINRIAGGSGGIFSRIPFPPCNVSLTAFDWDLLSLLIGGDQRPYKELAEELHVSVRTMVREIQKLVEGMVIFSQPNLDFKGIRGLVPADVVVVFETQQARSAAEKKILEILDDFIFYAGMWTDQGEYSLLLPNALTGTGLIEEIKRIEGIGFARLELVDEHIDQHSETLLPYLERQLSLVKHERSSQTLPMKIASSRFLK